MFRLLVVVPGLASCANSPECVDDQCDAQSLLQTTSSVRVAKHSGTSDSGDAEGTEGPLLSLFVENRDLPEAGEPNVELPVCEHRCRRAGEQWEWDPQRINSPRFEKRKECRHDLWTTCSPTEQTLPLFTLREYDASNTRNPSWRGSTISRGPCEEHVRDHEDLPLIATTQGRLKFFEDFWSWFPNDGTLPTCNWNCCNFYDYDRSEGWQKRSFKFEGCTIIEMDEPDCEGEQRDSRLGWHNLFGAYFQFVDGTYSRVESRTFCAHGLCSGEPCAGSRSSRKYSMSCEETEWQPGEMD